MLLLSQLSNTNIMEVAHLKLTSRFSLNSKQFDMKAFNKLKSLTYRQQKRLNIWVKLPVQIP